MTKGMYSTGKRDANEGEILDVLKARNVRYAQLKPGNGADLIVCIHPMEYWEIKNPAQPTNKRKLTHEEYELLEYAGEMHIPYVVIETAEEAVDRLNLYFGRL